MKIKGNLIIHLERDEKPIDYIKVEGTVLVIHDTYSFKYEQKPDFEDFWNRFYNRVDFQKSYKEVKDYFIQTFQGKDLRRLSKKTGISEIKISSFVEFSEISDTNLKKLFRAYELKLKINVNGSFKIGDFNDVQLWMQNEAREIIANETVYSISKRTGINSATVNLFVSGGNIPLEKLGKIVEFKISV
jgi:hypothetical protein